jgi:hypothetical protein
LSVPIHIKHQQPFLSVPFRQHEAFGGLAVDGEGVSAGAMGVAVDEAVESAATLFAVGHLNGLGHCWQWFHKNLDGG